MAKAERPARQHYIPQFLLRNFSYKDQKKEIFRLNCRTGKIEKRSIQDTACGDGANPFWQLWGEKQESWLDKNVETRLAPFVKKCLSENEIKVFTRNFNLYAPELDDGQRISFLKNLFEIFLNRVFRYLMTENLNGEAKDKWLLNCRVLMQNLFAETGLIDGFCIASPAAGNCFIMPDSFGIFIWDMTKQRAFLESKKDYAKNIITAETLTEKNMLSLKMIQDSYNSMQAIFFPMAPNRGLFLFHEDMRKKKNLEKFFNTINSFEINLRAIGSAFSNGAAPYIYGGHKRKLDESYKKASEFFGF